MPWAWCYSQPCRIISNLLRPTGRQCSKVRVASSRQLLWELSCAAALSALLARQAAPALVSAWLQHQSAAGRISAQAISRVGNVVQQAQRSVGNAVQCRLINLVNSFTFCKPWVHLTALFLAKGAHSTCHARPAERAACQQACQHASQQHGAVGLTEALEHTMHRRLTHICNA